MFRVYQHHSLDSTRWNAFKPRHGDVVVASAYKSGTTWVQMIALRLLKRDQRLPEIDVVSPWLESPIVPLEHVLGVLASQEHRRVIKTHLPADGLLRHPDVRYIIVCRDARDVFMSLWNHYHNLVRYPFLRLPVHPRRVGPPLPPCPTSIGEFWQQWITRGWFEWECDGYPFWSNLRHTATWWECRYERNVHFVHFNDLLTDPLRTIGAISRHIGAPGDAETIAAVAEETSFDRMHANAEALIPHAQTMFRGGARSFIYKGTNGRWNGALTPTELELYDAAAARELTPACARWLEAGGDVSTMAPRKAPVHITGTWAMPAAVDPGLRLP